MARGRAVKQHVETITEIVPADLDAATGRHIARAHVDAIFGSADVGEQELVMQFLHLLHARRHSLDDDALDTRRADFLEQFRLVFDEEVPA